MASFEYTAVTEGGERVAGVVAGATEQAVLVELEQRRLVPVRIREQAQRPPILGRRGVPLRVLAQSYLQIGDLLKAGVPLLRGLKLLSGRKARPRLAAVFKELADGVSSGQELAEMMSRRPDVFPRIHVAMVRAGEKGGFLEAVFHRLGQFVTSQADLRAKVIGNLVYPTVLVVFGLTVLSVVFGVFIPMFRPMLERMKDRLPAVSRFVFAISDLVQGYGLVVLAVLVAAAVLIWHFSRRPAVARKLTEAKTWAPVLGPLVRALAAARFCRMFGTMLGNGIPVLTAMQIAKEAAGNTLMEEAIDSATASVRSGHGVAGPLGESGLFPDDVIEMIAVAESANNLDDVLVTIAETIEARIDRLLSAVVRLIEPILIMVIACVVTLVAAALILPMTRMTPGM
ncbi:MAG: type II secretion system F family protein [Phycisphaerales bacterium]|nr:type II secretion system F family protein [Phycisphaerales bacterium]